MRVALLEMLHPDAAPADTPIPPEGAIDEAVETAKSFCGAEAPGFVNGILDAALREMREDGSIVTADIDTTHARRPRAAPGAAPPSSCAAATSHPTPPRASSRTARRSPAQASAELERMSRASAAEPLPGQDSLL